MCNKNIDPEKVKIENTQLLRKQGIDVIEHLPWIEVATQRKDSDVAERCIVLAALLQLYFGAPRNFIKSYLEKNHLLSKLYKSEVYLLDVDYEHLKEIDKTNLYWSIEAIWALAWVGGLHDSLSLSTGVEDSLAGMLPNFEESEPAENFINSFRARPQSEVFRELDKLYRAHWYARNYGDNVSHLVDLDIVMERRKALEWVSDCNLEWDDIPLDT